MDCPWAGLPKFGLAAALSFGLRQRGGVGAARGARAYLVVSAKRVGEVAARRRAGGRDVLVADRLVDRHVLRLNLAQIPDAIRVAAARRIHDLTGNDEVA
jgi:hypothetical protein